MPTTPEPISADGPELDGSRPLRQQWRDVAFLHWAVDPAAVSPLLPPGVYPDLFDGRTYLGLVAFRMVDVGFARGPALPAFPETNVRLYSVDDSGRRGVVFVSLDADQPGLAVAGRMLCGLPYRWTRMQLRRSGSELTYLIHPRGIAAGSRLVVRAGDAMVGGPLEHFLTARWGLHVRHLGRTWYLPNTHERWPLHEAELIAWDDRLVGSLRLIEPAGRAPDHVAFSPGVRARFGRPRLSGARRPVRPPNGRSPSSA
jgi:uncharacterized protein YqjF (DUF2071 family)